MKAKKTDWKMVDHSGESAVVSAYDISQAYAMCLMPFKFVPEVLQNVCHATAITKPKHWDRYGGGMISRWEWLT